MSWWRMKSRDADFEREIQADIELEAEEQREKGLPPEQARHAAMRSFGNPTLIREQTHAVWAWNRLEFFLCDLRYSLRTLRRTPGFTIIALLVIALGIGANVALFTIVRHVLLQPLPYQNPERLAVFYERDKAIASHSPFLPVDAGSFWEWQTATRGQAQMALVSPFQDYNVSAEGGKLPEHIDAAWCTDNFFPLLGVQPSLGRSFTSEDDRPGATATVVLSYGFWKRRYASDPGAVGKTIWLDAKPYTVIGILPQSFVYAGALGGGNVQVWTPVRHEASAELLRTFGDHEFQVVARLAPGVTLGSLEKQLDTLQKSLHATHPSPAVHNGVLARSMLDDVVHDYKTPLCALLAATGCVLLIACVNVAGLLVARAAARNREFAIRTALGGGKFRLLRERLLESLVLSVGGGAVGLLLAWGTLIWFVHARHDMNRVESIHIDGVVVAFTFAIVLACALAAGSVSALGTLGGDALSDLKENSRSMSGGKSRTLLRRGLLSAEIGLTVVLLVGAGLLTKSFQKLRSTDIGVPVENTLTIQLSLPSIRYKEPEKRIAFFEELIRSVRALPGVSKAGLVSAAPAEGWNGDTLMSIPEHPPLPAGKGLDFMVRGADPGYFQAIGLPLLKGRLFREDERLERAKVVLISRGAADLFFPGENPIGKHLKDIGGDESWEIIGIVGDVRWNVAQPIHPTLYWPLYSNGYGFATIVLKSSQDVESLALPVQKIVGTLDPDLPVSRITTLEQAIGKSTVGSKFDSIVLVAFSAIALVLAAAGLYGVLAYLVTQRTPEFGIRFAIGAQRGQVLKLVLLDGLRPALAGLLAGLIASAAVVRWIKSMLYQTQPLDPAVFGSVGAILLVVAVAACVGPAWQASRLNPIKALRTE